MRWSLKNHCKRTYHLACAGDATAESDLRAYIKTLKWNRKKKRWNAKRKAMKKLTTSIAALGLAVVSSGCMTNGIANIAEALRQDTNSIHLKVDGWGVSITLDRNIGGTSITATEGVGASGVTLTPVTTLRVQQVK